MSEPHVSQAAIDELKVILSGIQNDVVEQKSSRIRSLVSQALSDLKRSDEDQKARDRKTADIVEAAQAFRKYHDKFDWSVAQFVEYWPLKFRPRMPGESQSDWERLLDRERKRAKAPPRQNADVKSKSEDEAKRHRREQNRRAQQNSRAKKAAQVAVEELARGKRDLTDDDLAVIKAAEDAARTCSIDSALFADLDAAMKQAEEAEERARGAKLG